MAGNRCLQIRSGLCNSDFAILFHLNLSNSSFWGIVENKGRAEASGEFVLQRRKRRVFLKLNYKRTFLVGLAFLSICAFWQMYDNIIPLILQGTFHLNETLTGAIMAADNVLAVFLLPLLGSLSDKADTRWGKRTPFIVVGTVLAVVLMMLLPHADKTGNFVLFVISLFSC